MCASHSDAAVTTPRSAPRTLILYFNGTFVNRQNGAHSRVKSLLTFLLGCGCAVTMYSYANHVECPWGPEEIALFKQQFPTVPLVLDRRTSPLLYWSKIRKKLSGMFPALIPRLLKLRLPGATPGYDALRRKHPDALYIVNYANGLLELNGVRPRDCAIETHDLDFLQFSKRFRHEITSTRIIEKFRSEIGLLQSAGALLSIAKTETGMFRLFFPDKQVFFLPNYRAAGPQAGAIRVSSPGYDYDMLFVGSRNPFNVDGIAGFLASQSALLQRFSLAIAGEVSLNPRIIAAAAGANHVSLLGFVDDLDALYPRVKVVIAPVDGTGLKIKVMEALAAGKPVFGSRHALDGLPEGSDRCAFPIEPAQMAAMLLDPVRLETASKAALAYSQTPSIAGDLADFQTFLNQVGLSQTSQTPLPPPWRP